MCAPDVAIRIPTQVWLLMGTLTAQDFPLPPALRTPTDLLNVDPKHYLLDNETDSIRVVRLRLGPGETTPAAQFREALVVCISECHVQLKIPKRTVLRVNLQDRMAKPEFTDGESIDVHMEAGTTRLISAGMRSIANLSTKPVEMLFIEREQAALDVRH